MKTDSYGEVINGDETFGAIAWWLRDMAKPVLIGWTDGEMTHLDILFTYTSVGDGNLQGGVNRGDLYVSIMRMGAFGFEVKDEDTHWSYYAEKLGVGRGENATTLGLAELINGVNKKLLI